MVFTKLAAFRVQAQGIYFPAHPNNIYLTQTEQQDNLEDIVPLYNPKYEVMIHAITRMEIITYSVKNSGRDTW